MNHIPQILVKFLQSCVSYYPRLSREPTYIRDTEDHHSIDPQISSHPLQSNIVEDVIDNFRIHDEAVQEVEIFLAELRRSAFTQPSSIPSNIVRQEYISNLLITKVGSILPVPYYLSNL